MRIAIVTGTQPTHQHLCVQLSQGHEVVGILHPRPSSKSKSRFAKLRKQVKEYGVSWTFLHAIGTALQSSRFPSFNGRVSAESERLLAEAGREYAALPARLIHREVPVQSPQAAELMRSLAPEVAVVLGGPVYPPAFIQAVPLMLNFHSGLSPFYNGASTNYFAYANGHPQLCAGTLMVMNAAVDGGDMLGHYFPAIAAEDGPATLQRKTVLGAVTMFDRILRHFEAGGVSYRSVAQPHALLYYRGMDWSLQHALQIRRHLRRGVCRKKVRPESIIEYWREPDADSARRLYETTVRKTIWEEA